MAHEAVANDASLSPPEHILTLLGLDQSSIATELRFMVAGRFRQPQQVQLAGMLQAMRSTAALANVTVWFSHQFDPTDDVEHYLQDLIRMHHYISAHDRQRSLRNSHLANPESPSRRGSIYSGSIINSVGDSTVTKQLMHFYASFPDTRDRHLLTKIYQTLGLSRAITYCVVAQTLTFKIQKEFLDLYADGLPELRVWINWLDDLEYIASPIASTVDEGSSAPIGLGYQSAVDFMGRTIREHCTITWLELLRPLDTPKRLEVIGAVHSLLDAPSNGGLLSMTTTNVSSTLKKLGRFFETTSISARKLLDLDPAVRRELSLLLEEFPIIVLITLFDKFNSEKMIHLVVKRGLPFFPKNDLLKMLNALAPADTNAIEVFVATLFNFGRKKIDFLLLFLAFSSPNQLRFLDIMVATSNSSLNTDPASQPEEEDDDDAFSSNSRMKGNFFLLKLFLYAHFSSADLVIHKLSTLPIEVIQQLMYGVTVHSIDDFVVLGRGLETVELPCLQPFLRLFFTVQIEWRETLVKLVEEMPGEETLLLYDTLLSLCGVGNSTSDGNKVTTILQMLGGLDKKDKTLLCRHILVTHSETQVEQDAVAPSSTGIHAKVLLYLCECELSRHKVLRLLRAIPFGEYDRLLSLLCTQRMPEQVVLTRLMLSIPSDVNCRILAKMSAWAPQALDAFFQLLLMLPKVEYKMFAKLMGSQYVTGEQLQMFIMVSVDMMNQASSRELVIFAAELPVPTRNLFFEMLVGQPEKGVLLRIISYSTRVAPELMHILVAQFHRMTWEIRSSFVEQLRALDASSDVENLAEFASCLEDNESLRRLVLLFNPFPIPIRVRLVAIFLQLNVHERLLALTRLVEMPKNTVLSFCAAICNPNCAPVSPSFCRVIGLVDAKLHFSLLRLLNSEPLWFFLRLMAEFCKSGVDERVQAGSLELLNQMAKLLDLFTADEHHLVLQEVIREALADSMSLQDIVAVLSLFPEASRLLDFLRYVNGFAKYARSSLLFRVLSKYQQSAFIFEMCRVLDLDDAVFALKRLDRMWQRRHVELDKAMEPLALRLAGGSAQVKDEFCDLIVGFRALPATLADTNKSKDSPPTERILIPRSTELCSPAKEAGYDTDNEEDPDTQLRLPSATPPSHQPVQLNRHLQRTRPEQAFPRKRTDRKAWWQDLDDSAWLLLRSDRQNETASPENHTPRRQNVEQQEQVLPTESSSSLPSVFILTEQPNSTSSHEVTTALSDCEGTNTLANLSSHIEILPPLSRAAQEQQSLDERGAAEWRHSRVETEDINHGSLLSRSESAPVTLSFQNESPWSRQKRCRGVAAALDDQLDFHVGRDKGADFLQKQRDKVRHEKGVSRIRHARTPSAQAHIMEARVSRALGTRQVAVQVALSPLARPDHRTIENAVVMLAKAAQLRESTCHGFIAELPIRDPPPIKHHARMLPINTAKPSTGVPPSAEPDPNLSSEPVAPW